MLSMLLVDCRSDGVGRGRTPSLPTPVGPVNLTSNRRFDMQAKLVTVFSQVAELGLFFVVAVAMAVGLLGLR